MIKFIIAAILVVGFFIVTLPFLFFVWLINFISPKLHDKWAFSVMQNAFKMILVFCGIKVTIKGAENVPEGPVLFVGNHRSYFDIIVLYSFIDRPTGFIAKKEFDKIPSMRTWIKTLHGLMLDRENPKEALKTIVTASENIKKGYSYFIFPEGTRNKGEGVMDFKEGSFKIATKGKCPIVPFTLTNTAEIFEKHFPKIEGKHVILRYGEPVYPDKLSKEELKVVGATCHDVVEKMFAEESQEK